MSAKHLTARDSPFFVPPILDFLGSLVQRHRDFWLWLGRLESNLLAEPLRKISIDSPIFIAGLARSGSTVLHEIICSHPGVASHRVKDYPLVFTPYWWRQASAKMRPQAPRERSHQDRVMITTDSPDALEEMLWMAFFPHCHDPSVSSVLTADYRHAGFEEFYKAHIRKLMLAEGALRYAAKANYHVARLSYLARLFPDARFIIPVREPAQHILSLARQHQRFSRGQRRHPRALAVMRRSGHFEFGLDRRPLNLGDTSVTDEIQRLWQQGQEIRGLAMYWNLVYGHIAGVLAADPVVRQAAVIVRFESLCSQPEATLDTILSHCQLPQARAVIEYYAPRISYPDYYATSLSRDELAVIRTETAECARDFGYQPAGA